MGYVIIALMFLVGRAISKEYFARFLFGMATMVILK